METMRFIKNTGIFFVLSRQHGDAYFRKKIVANLLKEYCLGKMAVSNVNIKNSGFYNVFNYNGHIGILRYWLSEGPEVTKEEMAVLMEKLTYGYFYIKNR